MSGRRIDLSATQVVASMLAAVTGAVAASTLGIAGTVIGAAVMSVASTAVASVYKHYIARSHERIRAAAEAAKIPPLVGGGAGSALRRLQRASQTARQTGQSTPTVSDHRHVAGAEADKTEVFPAVGFGQHRWHDADRANGFAHHPYSPADGATEIIGGAAASRAAEAGRGSAAEPGGGSTAEIGESTGDAGPSEGLPGGRAGSQNGEPDGDDAASVGTPAPEGAGRSRWRRPLVMAGAALGVFLLAMGGITAFEAVAGKPLDSIVGGKHNSGTTIGSLIGGQSAHTASHHATTPTPAPGSSTSPSSTPSPTATPTPTPTATPTPTPTPTRSAGASTAPSAGAPADPAATR